MRNMSKKAWKLRVWNHMTEMQKLDILLKHAKVPHTYDCNFLNCRDECGMVFAAREVTVMNRGSLKLWAARYSATAMTWKVGSQLVRLQRCGGAGNMLRKIAEYVKKIFRMEPIPTTVSTLREALQALEVARNHFEHCDPEFVDAAIFELNAAECRVDAVRRCVG